jgi:hypothetical protein
MSTDRESGRGNKRASGESGYGLGNDISFNIFKRGQGKIGGDPRDQEFYTREGNGIQGTAKGSTTLSKNQADEIKDNTRNSHATLKNTIYYCWSYCKKIEVQFTRELD